MGREREGAEDVKERGRRETKNVERGRKEWGVGGGEEREEGGAEGDKKVGEREGGTEGREEGEERGDGVENGT